MAHGTITSLRRLQGFGFITPESKRNNVFFHRSTVEGDRFDQLREGQRVEFAESSDPLDPKRTRADHVRLSEA